MTGWDYFDCASACVLSRPVPTVDDRNGSTNFDCVIEYSHFRLASARYEARIKDNNYTIISQQFNDIWASMILK